MKKILAIALALVMVLAMVACGEKPAPTPDPDPTPDPTPTVITNADEIADEMTTEDGKYEIGFVTDVGQLKDGSLQQGTFEALSCMLPTTASATSTTCPPMAIRPPMTTAMTP